LGCCPSPHLAQDGDRTKQAIRRWCVYEGTFKDGRFSTGTGTYTLPKRAMKLRKGNWSTEEIKGKGVARFSPKRIGPTRATLKRASRTDSARITPFADGGPLRGRMGAGAITGQASPQIMPMACARKVVPQCQPPNGKGVMQSPAANSIRRLGGRASSKGRGQDHLPRWRGFMMVKSSMRPRWQPAR